jgi:hypothetical protein
MAAATALVRHVRYHVSLGFDSVWQFATHEWRQRLSVAPDLAALAQGGSLQWVSSDIGLPRAFEPRCEPSGPDP